MGARLHRFCTPISPKLLGPSITGCASHRHRWHSTGEFLALSDQAAAKHVGPVALAFGTGLPAAAILIELATGWCAGAFFDPIPSFAHLLLVSLVPTVNLLIWMALRGEVTAPRWLATAGGASIAVSATYSLLFLPILPLAALGIIFFGIGLLPFAPLVAATSAIGWTRRIGSWQAPPGRWIALGCGAGVLLLTAADMPATAVHLALDRYAGSAADRGGAVQLMRALGSRDMLLRIAHGDDARATGLVSWLVSSWSRRDWEAGRNNSGNARELYYRVTGEAFNSRPLPTGGLAARHRWFRFDEDLGGQQVGARVEGLSLAASRIDVAAASADSLAYTEWTLEVANAADVQNEARFTLAMPEGAVASRATLWVNGVPREASVAGRAETRAAYSKVVSARRDPLLVTTDGAGRLLVQAFPIQPRDSMKLRIGYTAPFAIAPNGRRSQALPAIVERNFEIDSDFAHQSWVAGDAPLRWAGEAAPLDRAPLRRGFRDAAMLSARPRFEATTLSEPSIRSGKTDGREPIAIEQRIERERDGTRMLMIVLDASAPMAKTGAALATALDSLPAKLPVGLVVASDDIVAVDPAPWSSNQRARILSALRATRYRGGQDNLPALADAVARAGIEGGALLWLHGAQPVEFARSRTALVQTLERAEQLPRLVRYQANPGRAFTVQAAPMFEQAVMSTPTGAPAADLSAILAGMAREGWRTTYRRVPPTTGQHSAHLVRLWAARELSDDGAAAGEARTRAIALAHRLNLITPVSGAVVLETDDDYKDNDLPVPTAGDVPTIPEPEVWALIFILAGSAAWALRRRLAVQRMQFA